MTPEERKLYEEGCKDAKKLTEHLQELRKSPQAMEEVHRMLRNVALACDEIGYTNEGTEVVQTINGKRDSLICQCENEEYATLIANLLNKSGGIL